MNLGLTANRRSSDVLEDHRDEKRVLEKLGKNRNGHIRYGYWHFFRVSLNFYALLSFISSLYSRSYLLKLDWDLSCPALQPGDDIKR